MLDCTRGNTRERNVGVRGMGVAEMVSQTDAQITNADKFLLLQRNDWRIPAGHIFRLRAAFAATSASTPRSIVGADETDI